MRKFFEAMSSNAVEELLGVRRCTRWTVELSDGFSAPCALDLPPLACKIWGRDRGSASVNKMTAKLLDHEDCEINLLLRENERVSPGLWSDWRDEPVVTALVQVWLPIALLSSCV